MKKKEEKTLTVWPILTVTTFGTDTHTNKHCDSMTEEKKTRQLEKLEKETALSLKHPMECKKVRKQDIYVV